MQFKIASATPFLLATALLFSPTCAQADYCETPVSMCEVPVAAPICPVSVTVDLPVFNKYVWRGINIVNDWVFQPSMSVSWEGFTLSAWADMQLTNEISTGETIIDFSSSNFEIEEHPAGFIGEIDLIFSYTYAFGCNKEWIATVGIIDYEYPNCELHCTQEVYATLAWAGFLNPRITVYHDINQVHGWLGEFGASYTFAKVWSICGMSMDFALSGVTRYQSGDYVHFYYLTESEKAAWTDFAVTAAAPFRLSDHWTLTPSVTYARLINNRVRNAASDNGIHADNTIFGINLAASW